MTKGVDSFNSGIVAPPVQMPDQTDATAAINVAECCSRCHANSKCEVFELGPGGCGGGSAPNCSASTINCFLIGGFTGKLRPNNKRATGCVRGAPAPGPPSPPPGPPAPAVDPLEMAQNNTVAAFLIARGASAMLELPVAGAYESMAMYAVDAPVLALDFGAALGPGKESSPGVFTRAFQRGAVELDCKAWRSTFTAS